MGRRSIQLALIVVLVLAGSVIWTQYIRKTEDKNTSGYEGGIVADERPLIGLSVDSMVIERWHRDVDIIKTTAEELGYRLEVVNSYEDSDKQIEQIRSLIDIGADAILIIPHEKDKLSEVILQAKKGDILVVAYDRLIENADVDAYVTFDNKRVGVLMAEAMIEAVPRGNYVIINGAPQDNNSYMINEGYYSVLKPHIDSGDINIVYETWAENWREEFAYNSVNRLMQQKIQIDGIICANDLLAEAAASALAEYGKLGEIPLVGQDANISACQRVVEGKQLMTVYKPLKDLAQGSVVLIDSMLRGIGISSDETINDGQHQVPYIYFDVIGVTADNMKDTVIKDFFHSEEDVYRLMNN